MASHVAESAGAAATTPVLPADMPGLADNVRAFLVRGGTSWDLVASLPLWLARAAADWLPWLRSPTLPMREVRDEYIPVEGGSVQLRVYSPPADVAVAGGPPILFSHGGAYVLCSIDSHDWLCRKLALCTGLVVVSVGYRLPPAHPPPTLHRDVCAAYAWTVARAAELSGAPARATPPGVIVCGDSAGGNLSTALTLQLLMARRGEATFLGPEAATLPLPAMQVLLYPSLDFTSARPSVSRYASGWLLSARFRAYTIGLYLGEGPEAQARRRNPIFSPLLAPAAVLAGMPRTIIVTAEHDMLHDEAVAYAGKLAAAGVEVQHVEARGLFHGFATMFEFACPVVEDVCHRIRAVPAQEAPAGGSSAGGR
jgi:acetyl esterase